MSTVYYTPSVLVELVRAFRKQWMDSVRLSELVQLKLNIGTSVGDSTPTEAENGTRTVDKKYI